jgi:cysteine desulfurase / selenocysteine lyase
MSTDWQRVRSEFPALQGCTFLDTATFGQLPHRAVEAVSQHFTRRDETACRDFLSWFEDAERTRAKIAQLIGASADDIAFVQNASTALGTLIAGIAWRAGDRVVTLAHEFPNNLYAPAALVERGVEFVETAWECFNEALSGRTRLVLLSTVNYATGFRPPLETIGPRLRERGIALYVDGTQSVGALRFDVERVQPAALAVHGYKWLLCPNGCGFLYLRPDVRDWLPANVVGWRSHYDWRNVDNLHPGRPRPSPRAEKYEGGMLAMPLVYALDASVNMHLELGPEAIERRVMGLAARLRELLLAAGATVPDHGSQIVTACFPGVDAGALRQRLEEGKIYVSARHGALRVSAHFYNDENDLIRFRDALDKALLT